MVCRARGLLQEGTFSSAALLSASGLGVVAAGGVFAVSESVAAITSPLFVNEFTLFFFSENKNILLLHTHTLIHTKQSAYNCWNQKIIII